MEVSIDLEAFISQGAFINQEEVSTDFVAFINQEASTDLVAFTNLEAQNNQEAFINQEAYIDLESLAFNQGASINFMEDISKEVFINFMDIN